MVDVASDLEDVVEYDPRRPGSFAGSDGKVTLEPNEDASTPRMSSINNVRMSAIDMKKYKECRGANAGAWRNR